MHYNILVLEGGGAKGPLHLGELSVIEKAIGKKLVEFIDLFATTSIGGVEASVYATGKLWVDQFWSILEPNLKDIFSSKFPWSIPRYDWRKYKKLYNKDIGQCKFGDVMSKFMFTTVDLITGHTHYIKSWHDEYKEHSMPDIVHRTFAAPLYFGGVYDNASKAIWSDGGTGFFNLPLIEAYTQALSLGWLDKGNTVHILALGTGRKLYRMNYTKEARKGPIGMSISEVRRYLSKDDGGMARATSARTQVGTLRKLCKSHANLSFQWVDWYPMPRALDVIDNWKARWEYYNKGTQLGQTIDINALQQS